MDKIQVEAVMKKGNIVNKPWVENINMNIRFICNITTEHTNACFEKNILLDDVHTTAFIFLFFK